MILSSASPRSCSCSPPITRAGINTSDFVIGRSLSTQMSSGSPSPFSAPGESRVTSSAQYVCGMNPYNAGGCDDVRCGRSTFRYPLALSTSYLMRSNGVISTNTFTTRGASSPAERPCHGWGRQREKFMARDCRRLGDQPPLRAVVRDEEQQHEADEPQRDGEQRERASSAQAEDGRGEAGEHRGAEAAELFFDARDIVRRRTGHRGDRECGGGEDRDEEECARRDHEGGDATEEERDRQQRAEDADHRAGFERHGFAYEKNSFTFSIIFFSCGGFSPSINPSCLSRRRCFAESDVGIFTATWT